jgi:hypothetical protein
MKTMKNTKTVKTTRWACLGTLSMSMGLILAQTAQATFVPPEDLKRPGVWSKGLSSISETDFQAAVQQVGDLYKDRISVHGGRLSTKGNWGNNTPNAFASQRLGSWSIEITGGLARRPEMTLDGVQLVLCHELGHHLGGFPFVSRWAANEGQSDYFATQVCARNIWASEVEKNASFRTSATAEVKAICDSVWSAVQDQNLCYRSMTASQALGNTLAGLSGKPLPSLSTPDSNQVEKTNNKHPVAQCRLDTYAQGALCAAGFNEALIPGKKTSGGVGGLAAEKEALENSCSALTNFTVGLRPTCWFKGRL